MSDNWKAIEEKWKKKWEKARIFEADSDPGQEKCFVTFPYPYMNGPLHVGHGFTATRVDIYARFMRMRGYNTLFPWAWHWTGEPIVGAALRIEKGEKELIRALKEIDGVPDEELVKFVDPVYMADYYTREGREVLRKIGFSIDWRREFHTTSLEPTYSRFIEWQYETLREKGYVARGTHPVVWCPHDQSPTGDHDRLEGEGAFPEEYTLLKFRYNDAFLPAATFRPETIYGITNMFLNPEVTYVEARVNDEKWIVSKEAIAKLSEQLKKVEVLREFEGAALVGQNFEDPITGRKLPILPGWFVDPNSATGVVYSVPAHAPADWIALKDLIQKPEDLTKFGIDPAAVIGIKPISLISVEGFCDYPAVEIVEQMKIKDQFDPRLDQATSEVYRKEFHTGILKPICGKYSGRFVRDVKAELIEDLKKANIADSLYDLPEKVVCRCTTRCIVKILSDQWFLKYSDPEWKKTTHEAIDAAKIFPESARAYFHDKIDWLRDWACARRTGLGTPLPWSPGWIVETLSDSTIYMAYYTIVKHIRQDDVKPEQLTNRVFDFIFFGKGDIGKVAKESGIRPSVLGAMRDEFAYWYPVDLRVSAKELVPNHLSFFVFQHVALFSKNCWPRGIGVNGMLTIEGQKMSKSKGNFLTLRNVVNNFGADVTRLTLVLGSEDMNDPDWREENAKSIDTKLKAMQAFVSRILNTSGEPRTRSVDRWLISSVQNRIREVTEAIEALKTRTAAEIAVFEVWNDIRWYLRRADAPNQQILKEAANVWIRLLAPFAPYLCEELWHLLGNETFLISAKWPDYDSSKKDIKSEKTEKFIRGLIEDTMDVLKVTKITPRRICYYPAATWKWRAFMRILEKSVLGKVEMREVMKGLMEEPELKKVAKNLAGFVGRVVEETNAIAESQKRDLLNIGVLDEKSEMAEAKTFLEKEFSASVSIYNEEDKERFDPKGRAATAKPYRPAIYVE